MGSGLAYALATVTLSELGSARIFPTLKHHEIRVNNERIFKMAFASVYPYYVTKVEKSTTGERAIYYRIIRA